MFGVSAGRCKFGESAIPGNPAIYVDRDAGVLKLSCVNLGRQACMFRRLVSFV